MHPAILINRNQSVLCTRLDVIPHSNISLLIQLIDTINSQDTFAKHLEQSFCNYYGFWNL